MISCWLLVLDGVGATCYYVISVYPCKQAQNIMTCIHKIQKCLILSINKVIIFLVLAHMVAKWKQLCIYLFILVPQLPQSSNRDHEAHAKLIFTALEPRLTT